MSPPENSKLLYRGSVSCIVQCVHYHPTSEQFLRRRHHVAIAFPAPSLCCVQRAGTHRRSSVHFCFLAAQRTDGYRLFSICALGHEDGHTHYHYLAADRILSYQTFSDLHNTRRRIQHGEDCPTASEEKGKRIWHTA